MKTDDRTLYISETCIYSVEIRDGETVNDAFQRWLDINEGFIAVEDRSVTLDGRDVTGEAEGAE